jgi:hypothetical protein
MTFSVKPGVEISDLHLAMVQALPIICDTFQAFGLKTTCTSGRDGEHMNGSLHYQGRALDFRTWADDQGTQLRASIKEKIAEEIQRELGPRYDVVPEATHIHVEYDA